MEGHAWFWILFGAFWLLSYHHGWAWTSCGSSRSRRAASPTDARYGGGPFEGEAPFDEPDSGDEPRRTGRPPRHRSAPRRSLAGETPVEALQRRFVEGQLTVEEYEEKVAHLFRGS